MDSFIGEVRIFAFQYAPQDWALCDGAIVTVNQNPALYSILQNYYGGTPGQNFALPDLRCRAVLGATAATALNVSTGADSVTLTDRQSAPHTHQLNAHGGATTTAETQAPTQNTSYISRLVTPAQGSTPARIERAFCKPGTGIPDSTMFAGVIGPSGTSGSHENRQPYLAMNFCISLAGIYPERP